MTRVRYKVAVSIDGFLAPEDGSVDWLEPYRADSMGVMGAFMKEIGGAIVGRATFDLGVSLGGIAAFASLPTLVMTSRPVATELPQGMIVAGGACFPAVGQLKAAMKSGDIWLMGGGVTASNFLDAGLIDSVELTTVPVALVKGKPLFGGSATRRNFRLRSSVTGALGTVSTVYERA